MVALSISRPAESAHLAAPVSIGPDTVATGVDTDATGADTVVTGADAHAVLANRTRMSFVIKRQGDIKNM
jgi:hypothetical protein